MTTGDVERIVEAVNKVAQQKETAFCDSFPAYLALSSALKNAYYMDTIHQSQRGLTFLGQLVFTTLQSEP